MDMTVRLLLSDMISNMDESKRDVSMGQSYKSMPKGLRVSSWIVAIVTIIACYAIIALLGADGTTETTADTDLSNTNDSILDRATAILLVTIPLLQTINLILGIIVAARKDPDALSVTRAIMLTYKIGLIPFFILGGVIELLCIVGGFHPVLIGFMWTIGLGLGVLGWLTVMSGSIWTIAAAIKAKRSAMISSGECTLYIILSVFFVADVVGSIVLFVRSRRPRTAA